MHPGTAKTVCPVRQEPRLNSGFRKQCANHYAFLKDVLGSKCAVSAGMKKLLDYFASETSDVEPALYDLPYEDEERQFETWVAGESWR